MRNTFPIFVIIATSGRRTEKLLYQALPSVLSQSHLPDVCIVVDDNFEPSEYARIALGLQELQMDTSIELVLIPNTRTRGHSGTGAWNSGLSYARAYARIQGWDDVYLLILDDDDRWHPEHVALCAEHMSNMPDAIFCNLIRVYDTYEDNGKLTSQRDLSIEHFLYGNPGVQGSNMCFRLARIEAIGGFDEALRSCTDRDLMIRFLERFGNENILIVATQTVWHDARHPECVTNNRKNKVAGLDTFYQKHLWRFDETILLRSLDRAVRLFYYPNARDIWMRFYQERACIAVMMPLHNNADTIRRAVLSFIEQQRTIHPSVLFIGDDASTDAWREEIADLIEQYNNIIIVKIVGGSPAKARNALAEYILEFYSNTYLMCRLDADDQLSSRNVLVEVERLFMDQDISVLLCGNYQLSNDKLLGQNYARRSFLDRDYMSERLRLMAEGDYTAELPSCNLCFRPHVYMPYPLEDSAEDHWLTIQMLMTIPHDNILVSEELMYCIYNVGGGATQKNRKDNTYINSRQRLYEYYVRSINS